MSVDKELARAIEESEAEHGVQAVAPVTAASEAGAATPKPKRSLGLLIALLVMVGGVLTLVFTSFEGSAIYSVGVDQLVKEQDRYGSRALRLTGMLVKGTLARRDEPCEYRFKLESKGSVLPVRFAQCVVPDTFRDMPGMDVEVTAEGKLGADGQFEASHLMAKCPSKYEMQQRAASGEAAPHVGQQSSPLQTFAKNSK